MDYCNQIQIINQAISLNPSWFSSGEGPCSESEILSIENELDSKLPRSFSIFSTIFGGGYFGKVNISSIRPASHFFVLSRPNIILGCKPVLVVSDDETGGYYFHKNEGDNFSEHVYYMDYNDKNSLEMISDNFFSFFVNYGLPC